MLVKLYVACRIPDSGWHFLLCSVYTKKMEYYCYIWYSTVRSALYDIVFKRVYKTFWAAMNFYSIYNHFPTKGTLLDSCYTLSISPEASHPHLPCVTMLRMKWIARNDTLWNIFPGGYFPDKHNLHLFNSRGIPYFSYISSKSTLLIFFSYAHTTNSLA